MKIGHAMLPSDTPPAQDMRQRLGTETCFDSTLRDLEHAMWPGSRAGRQPTPHLPTEHMTAFQEPAPERSISRSTSIPTAMDEPAPLAMQGMDPQHPSAVVTPSSSARMAYAMPDETSEATLSATASVPAMPHLDTAEDAEGTTPVRSATRWQEPSAQPQSQATVVTWTEGSTGASLVIRQGATDTDHTAADALAQVRRHGLSPRRVTVNGVTTEHPHHEDESP
ncbi:MAG: hypothetical protein GAK28_03875 [Luteibacter sp.]|uniref:hypothetical protein n=1 Tax=Luteibacter sp. TaxID=1886636 RepID=UPI00137EE3A6|nr:hypothetical protein [Luteibacter sp.]KAF1004673.1 MAG: hypothetical protein GAK28_03875 [Luteibacter sp.]